MMHSHGAERQQDQTEAFRQKPDGDIDPPGEVGWYLQRAREQRGESLEHAGSAIGIHPYHLEGIENGDLTRMPPRSETLGMLGAYAQYLGFDPQPLVLHYNEFLPQPMPTPTRKGRTKGKPRALSSAKILEFPLAERLKSLPAGAGGIVASVFAVMLVMGGGVWLLQGGEGTGKQSAAGLTASSALPSNPVTKEKQIAGDRQIVSSITKLTEKVLDDGDDAKVAMETTAKAPLEDAGGGLSGIGALIERNIGSSAVSLPEPAPVAAPAAAPVEKVVRKKLQITEKLAAATKVDPATVTLQGKTGRIYGANNRNSRLKLMAKDNVWIRIEDQQGNVVMTQTLMKGDAYRVPNREGLIVITRDGGLVSYAIDGVEKGRLGADGEILVGQSLDLKELASQG